MSDDHGSTCPACQAKDEQIAELAAHVAVFKERDEARRSRVREHLATLMEHGDDISDLLEAIQQGGNDLGDFLFPTP